MALQRVLSQIRSKQGGGLIWGGGLIVIRTVYNNFLNAHKIWRKFKQTFIDRPSRPSRPSHHNSRFALVVRLVALDPEGNL